MITVDDQTIGDTDATPVVVRGARPLHPRHGPHDPALTTPRRQPASLRRTTTIDTSWPGGLGGSLELSGRGRDLWTSLDGTARILAEARVTVDLDLERRVTAIAVEPPEGDTSALMGVRATAGFRTALDACRAPDQAAGSLAYHLLDDVPVATLVSGFALMSGGVRVERDMDETMSAMADLCAGWAADATIFDDIRATDEVPLVTGPPAPSLGLHDDVLAWHDLPPLAVHSMRRHRRTDLWRDGDTVMVDAFFRDTHMAEHEFQTVVHEYGVRARFDGASNTFVACVAVPSTLPWIECSSAAASAGRVVGMTADHLRKAVRQQFVGRSTCTHLNDTLRALEDVPHLIDRLPTA
jgi:hypothetical protein